MTLFVVVLVLVALWVVANLLAMRFSLHPFRTPPYLSPGALGYPQESFVIPYGNGTISGWWMPAENPKGTIVYAHGYVMNRCELVAEAILLHKEGYNALLFDFPAHGLSRGGVCTIGLNERNDVLAMAAEARRRSPDLPLGAFGSSMGAAAIVFAVADQPKTFDFLILDGAYARLRDAIESWWGMLGGRVLSTLLRPTRWIARVVLKKDLAHISVPVAMAGVPDVPILILHGEKDMVAPISAAEEIHAAANQRDALAPVRLVRFADMGHCQARIFDVFAYQRAVLDFIMEVGSAPPGPSDPTLPNA